MVLFVVYLTGARGRGMEVRAQQALDQLLRGGRHGTAAFQRNAVPQEYPVRLALAAAPAVRPRARQARAHAHHTGTGTRPHLLT